MKQGVLICLIFMLTVNFLHAQASDEFTMLKKVYNPDADGSKRPVYSFREMKSKGLSDYLFVFYKKFISSQDMSRCPFEPSCSAYAYIAVRQKGWIIGVLAAFDRLSRDNSFKDEYYPEIQPGGQLSDPFPY